MKVLKKFAEITNFINTESEQNLLKCVFETMRNDSLLKALRPHIETENKTFTEIEKFQNDVLRPILKFQHALFEKEVANNIIINKLLQKQITVEKKRSLIKGVISKTAIKYQLLGQITGFLTEIEYQYYHSNKSDIDKRIFAMLLDRILSIEK